MRFHGTVTAYIADLKAQNRDPDHVRISQWMLNRLVELGGWRRFADITKTSMDKVLARLEADGATVSYRNKFIKRAKAFVHALLPDGWANQLTKLRRISERGAERSRARRAAAAAELTSLFALNLPDDRKLCYAFAAFNGLRRNEIRRLRWGHLKLDAPIPFLGLRQKQGDDDTQDFVPLHPYVLSLVNDRTAGLPNEGLVRSVPDMKTMAKDLTRAGVTMADDRGRRLDFHALRHTFSTNLDLAGCSRATKKKLMRHAPDDVTDGYTHAELAEMAAVLRRLPWPEAAPSQTAVMTATDDAVARTDELQDDSTAHQGRGRRRAAHQGAHQALVLNGQSTAVSGTEAPEEGVEGVSPCRTLQPRYNPGVGNGGRSVATTGTQIDRKSFSEPNLRPSTQVD